MMLLHWMCLFHSAYKGQYVQSIRIWGIGLLLACLVPSQLTFAADKPATQLETSETTLRFADFFKLPIGPRGLEASSKLLQLDEHKVRMVGYMARQDGETAVPGLFILTPLPVTLGDEDESFSDDLPATMLYVHLTAAEQQGYVQHMPGLLTVRGTLELGPKPEVDGRISFVRLRLDGEPAGIAAVPVAVPSP
ncbi:MAG: hypothetical protein ACI90C_000972 [Rhodoferax sp.]|jgi:hypothetical protein